MTCTAGHGSETPKTTEPLLLTVQTKSGQRDGPWLKLPGHAVRLTPADQRLWGGIRVVMQRGRYQPPRVRDFAQTLGVAEDEVRRLLRRLARMGLLVEVAHDHFYQRETVAELAAAAHLLADNSREDQAGLAGDFR